jgi:hypothetical protein
VAHPVSRDEVAPSCATPLSANLQECTARTFFRVVNANKQLHCSIDKREQHRIIKMINSSDPLSLLLSSTGTADGHQSTFQINPATAPPHLSPNRARYVTRPSR